MSPTSSGTHASSEPPRARIKRHWGLLWIWAVPLVALGLVGFLGYKYWLERGPLITITFNTAEGISPQKTEVRYKAVTLGTVQDVELSDDASHVAVHVRMKDQAESMLHEDTKFWVVRPRLGSDLSTLGQGLKTLVSGSYLAMDPGDSDGAFREHFKGLEEPPNVRSSQPGTVYFLEAEALGSISRGAPIYFRDVHVGELLGYDLLLDKRAVRFRVFVEAPYDKQVVEQTRFWRTSGLSVKTTAEGLSIELQSARALFLGGIAFGTFDGAASASPAPATKTFELYEGRAIAALSYYERVPYVSYFQGSARGLTKGTQVDMYGRTVGAVTDVSLTTDPRTGREGQMGIRVAFALQPERVFAEDERPFLHHEGMRRLVEHGLRAVLTTTSMLTGEKALSLQHTASSGPSSLAREGEALVIPGDVQSFEQVANSLSAAANEINRIPFAEIGGNLNRVLGSVAGAVSGPELKQALVDLRATLQQARSLVEEARQGLKPALARLPHIARKLEEAAANAKATVGARGYGADSTLQRNLERMTDRVSDAARSIELLTDYLNRHPEALLRGRQPEEP